MAKFTEREAGTYRSRFVKLDEDYEITDRQTGQKVTRWRWIFQETADTTTVGEIDTLTSPGFKKGSNGLRFFTGMLGRPPNNNDDTAQLIGQEFDVVYGPNRNGTLTITDVRKLATSYPTGLPEISAQHQEPPGELPF